MKSTETISKAKQLLNENEWASAKELLLLEGFVKQMNPDIAQAYETLIVPRAALIEHLSAEIAQLQDTNPEIRASAANAINKQARAETSIYSTEWLADPRTTGPLIDLLADQNAMVVESAAQALASIFFGHFQDLRAFDSLTSLLNSPRSKTRRAAVACIGHLQHKKKWDYLVPMLMDKSAEVRNTTCYALMKTGDDEKLPPLVIKSAIKSLTALKTDPNEEVRLLAFDALEKLSK
jgi:HEAT repeat protein